MADWALGKVELGTTDVKAKDAMSVTHTLTSTPIYQRAMADPIQRKEFLRALESKKEAAVAKNDTKMFDLLGKMIAATKDYEDGNQGFRAIG